MEKFIVTEPRLMKWLYCLGFDKTSIFTETGDENWEFLRSPALNESLDFYFYMRKRARREKEARK